MKPPAVATPCPGCAGPSRHAFRTADLNRRVDDSAFDYFRCDACGTVFLHPIPEDLGRFYPADYQRLPASRAELAAWAVAERHKLDALLPFAGDGRLCEIGPSTGAFACLAQDAGFEVEAIEMDRACSDFLRTELGIQVANTPDTAAALDGMRPFDVIALWHVVEHLPDPWTTLAAAERRLLPGGILILAAPNPRSFQFGVLGGRWAHVDAPRHVQLIPMRVMETRLAALGLELAHATTGDHAALGWNRFGWEHSLMSWGRRGRVRRALAIVGRALATLLAPLDRRPGRGSAYTMVFRKRTA